MFDKFVENNKDTELDVYFDDIQMATRGTTKIITKNMGKATAELRKSIEKDLCAELALDKAAVTSDDRATCDAVRRVVGEASGPPRPSCPVPWCRQHAGPTENSAGC